MNYSTVVFMIVAVLLLSPMTVAASGGHDHGSHDAGDEKAVSNQASHSDHDMHNEHDSMSADGSMIIIGSQVSKGVKGMAHVKDVSSAMAAMDMKTTHHFMMAFVDEKTGEQIEKGTVALKITNPNAKVSEAVELVGMDGHFGVDIVLDMKGEYHFRLGTKLEDGTKRKYHFHFVNK